MSGTHRIIPEISCKDQITFWSRVDQAAGPDGCWAWTGGLNRGGYGRFYIGCTCYLTHRIAWSLLRGLIPDGMQVLHDCPGGDNPRCVNPAHLWLGTDLDNHSDCRAKGRTASGARNGARTHPEKVRKGEQSPNAKLTAGQVREMRALYRTADDLGRWTQRRLARRFGVHQVTVSDIIRRERWAHVP